jgi:hypothetical protein
MVSLSTQLREAENTDLGREKHGNAPDAVVGPNEIGLKKERATPAS